ncbi:MAG: type II secretion system GspH family protein [Candidatus Omnitrophica bacterium]|nr:type II secretion system GspH family protein [Candidatus Omnitrophota bacterium]
MNISKNGFTFLEIMIAIGLFGIVVITCLSNYLTCIKNIKVINDKIYALILTNQKIQEMKINHEEIKEDTGVFSNSDFIWTIELSENIIYDTITNIEFIPYKLTIEGPYISYVSILPFLKVQKKNE